MFLPSGAHAAAKFKNATAFEARRLMPLEYYRVTNFRSMLANAVCIDQASRDYWRGIE